MKEYYYLCNKCQHTVDEPGLIRCPECQAMYSFDERERLVSAAHPNPHSESGQPPRGLDLIATQHHRRIPSGLFELDRVLGGGKQNLGLVPASVVSLTGDPGAGKSTLALQWAAGWCAQGMRVLYATGEESIEQVKGRAERLGISHANLILVAEGNVDVLFSHVEDLQPHFLIVDSINTAWCHETGPRVNRTSTIQTVAPMLVWAAKQLYQIPILIVAHVTKEGVMAGPNFLKHMVDTHLHLHGTKMRNARTLASEKNRFGDTAEMGHFTMTAEGLIPESTPIALDEEEESVAGRVIALHEEGSRLRFCEVQSLASTHVPDTALERSVTGIASDRMQRLLSILGKAGLPFNNINLIFEADTLTPLVDKMTDMAILLSLTSAALDVDLGNVLAIGEVKITGAFRGGGLSQMVYDEIAEKGFDRVFVPSVAKRDISEIGDAVVGFRTVKGLLSWVQKEADRQRPKPKRNQRRAKT